MTRKLTHIILALLLLVLTGCVQLNKHYCEGKMVAVSWNTEHKECCSDEEVNCCTIIAEKLLIEHDYLHSFQKINTENNYPGKIVPNSQSIFANTTFQNKLLQDFDVCSSPLPVETKHYLAMLQTYLL